MSYHRQSRGERQRPSLPALSPSPDALTPVLVLVALVGCAGLAEAPGGSCSLSLSPDGLTPLEFGSCVSHFWYVAVYLDPCPPVSSRKP